MHNLASAAFKSDLLHTFIGFYPYANGWHELEMGTNSSLSLSLPHWWILCVTIAGMLQCNITYVICVQIDDDIGRQPQTEQVSQVHTRELA